jgi:hypothetical protein
VHKVQQAMHKAQQVEATQVEARKRNKVDTG